MDGSLSERRLAENEVVFRQSNERVTNGLKQLEELAIEKDQTDLSPDLDNPVLFYCECSDANCLERIKLTPNTYQELHKNRSQFIVKTGHHTPSIERVRQSKDDYLVVEKYITPPETAEELHSIH